MQQFPLALIGGVGWTELLVLSLVGLLIFGRRLPEVGRSLGRGIVEFKKGLAGLEDEVDQAGSDSSSTQQLDSPPHRSANATQKDAAAATPPQETDKRGPTA